MVPRDLTDDPSKWCSDRTTTIITPLLAQPLWVFKVLSWAYTHLGLVSRLPQTELSRAFPIFIAPDALSYKRLPHHVSIFRIWFHWNANTQVSKSILHSRNV
jgi:hypothetical protein